MLLRQKEATERFGITSQSLHKWVEDGKLSEIRTPGGHRRYDEEELRNLLLLGRMTIAIDTSNSSRWMKLEAKFPLEEEVLEGWAIFQVVSANPEEAYQIALAKLKGGGNEKAYKITAY